MLFHNSDYLTHITCISSCFNKIKKSDVREREREGGGGAGRETPVRSVALPPQPEDTGEVCGQEEGPHPPAGT